MYIYVYLCIYTYIDTYVYIQGSSVILVTDDFRDKELDFGLYAGFSHMDTSYMITSKHNRSLEIKELNVRMRHIFKSQDIWSKSPLEKGPVWKTSYN
jgi:hypothetical protein